MKVVKNGRSLISVRDLLLLWGLAFIYSLAIGLILQKLVLPMMPDMHAGHGLMRDDAIYFHQTAVALAERINEVGWGEWKLIVSKSATGHVGLLAAIYATFGPDPAYFLPVTSFFHSLGAVLVVLIAVHLLPSKGGLRAGLAAGFLFLVFPSALVWFGQNHKDAFVIAGFLMALLAFLRSFEHSNWRRLFLNAVMFSAGLVVVVTMRPHMVSIFVAAFSCSFVALLMMAWLRGKARGWEVSLRPLLLVGLGVFVMSAPPAGPAGHSLSEGGLDGGDWEWKETDYLPKAVDRLFEKLAEVRAHFVNYGISVEAGSIVDAQNTPEDVAEVITYLPRALLVGLLAPFPNFWVEKLSLPRVIGALETLVFYLFLPGLFYFLRHQFSRPLIICLVVAAAVLTVNSFVSPNMGTLHRVRYGQWFVFLLVGACGWALLFERLMARFGGGVTGLPAPSSSQQPTAPSGSRAAGAGMLVMLVSLVGFLGLLVRDLLLIDRVGFGSSLDSYYLAIMLPTFFIGLLSLPLGDALSTRISQLVERSQVQRLLAGTTTFTLILFTLLSGALLLGAEGIFRAFSSDGNLTLTMRLLPIALLLLVSSGAIVVGNSILNSRGRPVLAASSQLLVPLIVVGFILVADEDEVVVSAMVGMAAGQLANLIALVILLKGLGYSLLPGSPKVLREESAMLSNCKWLALCALLTNAAVPMNYWFAGQIGVGALSTWALGSKLVQIASLLGASLMTAVFVPYMSKVVSLGLKARIRDNLFVSLTLGAWGSVIMVAVVFIFAEPIIYAAASGLDDPRTAERLVGILKLGALQLPFALTALLLFKLCAVSAASLKSVIAALSGLAANALLNLLLVPGMGLLGLALAWTLSSMMVALVVIVITRAKSGLDMKHVSMLLLIWTAVFLVAAAIHFKSWKVGIVVVLWISILLVMHLKPYSRPCENA